MLTQLVPAPVLCLNVWPKFIHSGQRYLCNRRCFPPTGTLPQDQGSIQEVEFPQQEPKSKFSLRAVFFHPLLWGQHLSIDAGIYGLEATALKDYYRWSVYLTSWLHVQVVFVVLLLTVSINHHRVCIISSYGHTDEKIQPEDAWRGLSLGSIFLVKYMAMGGASESGDNID